MSVSAIKKFAEYFELMLIDYIRFFHSVYDDNRNLDFNKILNETEKAIPLTELHETKQPHIGFIKTNIIMNDKRLHFVKLSDNIATVRLYNYKFNLVLNKQKYGTLNKVHLVTKQLPLEYFTTEVQLVNTYVLTEKNSWFYYKTNIQLIKLGTRHINIHVNDETQEIFFVPNTTKIPFTVPIDNKDTRYEVADYSSVLRYYAKPKYTRYKVLKRPMYSNYYLKNTIDNSCTLIFKVNDINPIKYNHTIQQIVNEIFDRYNEQFIQPDLCKPLVLAFQPNFTIVQVQCSIWKQGHTVFRIKIINENITE